MATSAPGNANSRLFFIHDRTLNTRFLVDTGAEVSVCPPSRFDRHRKSSNLTLQAANDTSICTYSTKLIALNLGLRRSFKWVFIIADVQYPIIGIDFLQCHKLLVDVHNKRLLDTVTHLKVNILASSLQPPISLLLFSLFLPNLKIYSQNTLILLKLLTLLNPLNIIFNITSQPMVNQLHHTQDACHQNDSRQLKRNFNT